MEKHRIMGKKTSNKPPQSLKKAGKDEEIRSTSSGGVTRRGLGWKTGVAAFLALEAAKEIYKKGVIDPAINALKGWIHDTLVPAETALSPETRKRTELAFGIFLSSEVRTEFVPPQAWDHAPPDVELPDGTKTYGHEYEVLRSIAVALSHFPITWDVKRESWLAHVNHSLVFIGSGQSNEGTRWILGRPDAEPLISPQLGGRIVDLEYTIGLGHGEIERWQYSELLKRNALAIRDRHGRNIWQAERSSGSLQSDDYLLVTRVPGPTPKTVFTTLAGLHGPGTRAAELLFSSLSLADLEDLAARIGFRTGHVPYYQAVFRASQFQLVNGSSVPTRVELVTEGCPPKRII